MNVSLTPQLQAFVEQKVATGRYQTASEVIREALRLLEEHDRLREMRLEEVRRALAVGSEQLARGEYTEHSTEGLFEHINEIKAKGRRRLQDRKRRVE